MVVQANTFAESMDDQGIVAQATDAADRSPGSRRVTSLVDIDAGGGFRGGVLAADSEYDGGYEQVQSDADDGRAEIAAGAAKSFPLDAVNAEVDANAHARRRLFAAMRDSVLLLSGDGRIEMANSPAAALLRVSDPVGRFWPDLWGTSESCEAARQALDGARRGRTERFQATMGETGATWWDVSVSPMADEGDGLRILAVARDITELKSNEARQTLLMQELSHRIKNTLAIVQAVATQTLRNAVSIESASEALGSRLIALAHAHDVLMQGAWSSADLRSLVDGAVALHGDGEPDRFRLSGPQVTLGPRPGLTLALMLHELGTNAAKYGALSSPDGHVAVTWEVVEIDGADHLRLRWEEIGGPPVVPPSRVGFGSRMIERSLVHSFGGTVTLTYPPTGAVLTLEAALGAVVADAL